MLVRATETDIETYLSIDMAVASKTYSHLTAREHVMEYLVRGPVYLIQATGRTVGTISYHIENGIADISGLAIHPDYQGRGLARQALELILQEIKGVTKIVLVTHPDNLKAIALYMSFGFKISERKENYFGDGEPRIIMEKQDFIGK